MLLLLNHVDLTGHWIGYWFALILLVGTVLLWLLWLLGGIEPVVVRCGELLDLRDVGLVEKPAVQVCVCLIQPKRHVAAGLDLSLNAAQRQVVTRAVFAVCKSPQNALTSKTPGFARTSHGTMHSMLSSSSTAYVPKIAVVGTVQSPRTSMKCAAT